MRKKLGKMFFDGVSKVFEGPNNAGNLKSATRVATIGGIKAKAKLSQATKKFKAKLAGMEEGIKKAAKNFKGKLDDKQVKSVAKEIKSKNKSKIIKEYLREPKMEGGMMRKNFRVGGPATKPKTKSAVKRITNSEEYKSAKYPQKVKMLGGKFATAKEMENRPSKMGGGMMGRQMYKKGSKKAVGKSSLGMQSVIHGLDSNPKITAADPKAKFIAKNKKT